MQFAELYPSRFINAASLEGESQRVVIKNITRQPIGNPPTSKVVAELTDGRELVLNKVNASRVALAFGNDVDDWRGREIELYQDFCDFGGRSVPAVRVRAITAITKRSRPAAIPVSDDIPM